jgi:LCP family protein required for cell wall assembly
VTTSPEPGRVSGRRPSPILAAVLSFFIPGLGQIYAGRVLRGVLIAVPQFVVLGILAWIWMTNGSGYLAGWLGVNAFSVAVVNVIMLVYRALAVVDAYLVARSSGTSTTPRRDTRWAALGAVVLAVLLVLTAGLHGVAAFDSYLAYEALDKVFDRCGDEELPSRDCETAGATPTPGPTLVPTATPLGTPTVPGQTAAPTEPGQTPGPTASPGATASPVPTPIIQTDAYWAENGRLDLLLLGSDAGPGRVGTRPDAVHVASVDLTTGRSAIVSLPRYLQYPPLPDELKHLWPCGCFRGFVTGYLNAVYTWATDHPADFPGGANRGFRATEGVVEELLGIDIDGIVVVDLNGFVDAVDAIGGVVINVPEPVVDDRYNNERGVREFVNIRAGWQEMDGHTALMYVRSRHQDSDIARLGRQQDFLRAMRRQLSACSVNLLPRLPDILRAIGESVRTDVPLEDVPTLLELLTRTKKPRRVELHSDNGFQRDLLEPGQLELYRGAMAAAFTPRPGDDVEEPEEVPPERFDNGC